MPYTVPDFPVPSEMMDRTPCDVVAQIALLVTLPRFAETGLHDFTLSSWISAEEIQVRNICGMFLQPPRCLQKQWKITKTIVFSIVLIDIQRKIV